MVYQKGCGNRLLRGTGRLRGNLCLAACAASNSCGKNLQQEKTEGKSRKNASEEKERRVGGKIEGRKLKKKQKEENRKKVEPGYSAEGPRDPGLSCPPPQ
jgi:hypothetical protein